MDPWCSPVGFSATIREINSRTTFDVGLLPTCFRTLEICRQYIRKPDRCQRTTVSGVTRMRESFQADQTLSDYPEKLIEQAEDRARMSTFQRDELLTQSKILALDCNWFRFSIAGLAFIVHWKLWECACLQVARFQGVLGKCENLCGLSLLSLLN
jgi:hypothetical protein